MRLAVLVMRSEPTEESSPFTKSGVSALGAAAAAAFLGSDIGPAAAGAGAGAPAGAGARVAGGGGGACPEGSVAASLGPEAITERGSFAGSTTLAGGFTITALPAPGAAAGGGGSA